uniref:Uncharacterized protein n=1 Tax=Laticauda laticaudata TaxID=8630 RepID=A0A8C5WV71_LATLA
MQYCRLLLLTASCLQFGSSNLTRLKVDSAFHPSEFKTTFLNCPNTPKYLTFTLLFMGILLLGAYGLRRSFFFFLKPSFWIKKTRNYEELYESCGNENLDFNQVIETIPSEFKGKEAIRYDRLSLIKFKLIKFEYHDSV